MMFAKTRFSNAIHDGNLDRLAEILDTGFDIDVPMYLNLRTPLHFAAQKGFADVASFLIGRGAAIEKKDSIGMTPLHVAAYYGQLGVAARLLKAGADPNIVSGSGSTAFGLAQSSGHPEMMEMLKPYMKKVSDLYELPALPEGSAKEPERSAPAGWELMDETRVAHTAESAVSGYRLTDIFDFAARERIRIVHNTLTQKDNIETVSFDDMGEGTALRAAFDALKSLGGQADAQSIEKRLDKPSRLQPPQAG